MLNQDKIIIGIILGTIIPFVGLALLKMLAEQNANPQADAAMGISEEFRLRTRALIAISLNLIPFIIYNRKRFINTMRGLVFPTMAYVGLWFFVYGRHIIGL